jgi:hypothetical protein
MPSQDSLQRLKTVVADYLETTVISPAMVTIEKDTDAQLCLVDLLLLVHLLEPIIADEGISYDKDHLESLPIHEIETRIEILGRFLESQESDVVLDDDEREQALRYLQEDSSRIHLLPYLRREVNWILVSILSASYISSLVLTRSLFELVIGIATKHIGLMKDRIDSISFLSSEEKRTVLKLWYRLCAWAHPYGKWIKEMCPVFSSMKPLYHPRLFQLVFIELMRVLDLYSVVAISKYEIGNSIIIERASQLQLDLKPFEMLWSRMIT